MSENQGNIVEISEVGADKPKNKSTGPRTAAGKARSSQNALLHGLTSKHPRLLSHEQPHHWLEHLEQYRVSYGPQNLTERDLVEDIAWFRWQLHRLSCVLAAVISMRLVGKKWQPDPDSHTDPNWHPIAKAFVEESGPDGAINTLNRYEARIQRDYHRSLNTLMRLRTHAELSKNLHAIPGVPAYIQDTRTPLPTEPEPPATPAPSLLTTNPEPTPSTANNELPNELPPIDEHPDFIELQNTVVNSIRPYPEAFHSFRTALEAMLERRKQEREAA
jgi:hypothetical protein